MIDENLEDDEDEDALNRTLSMKMESIINLEDVLVPPGSFRLSKLPEKLLQLNS